MGEYKGKCYYCKGDVIHSRQNDYGAFTKKWDKKSQRYILSDYWHMDCYYYEMKRLQGRPQERYRQISLFDLIKEKR